METKMKVELLSSTQNSEKVVAAAGKLCYSKVGVEKIIEKISDEEVERFLVMLNNMGHHSPLEHVSFTFGVEGVSRSLTHQLVRHRIGSYSQQSQRYVKIDQFEYVVPPQIRNNRVAKKIYIKQMESAQIAYNDICYKLLIDKAEEYGVYDLYCEYALDKLRKTHKINIISNERIEASSLEHYEDIVDLETYWMSIDKKTCSRIMKTIIEDARYVFPNACETKIVFTFNLRSLINFIRHRSCSRAQWEIRELANEIIKIMEKDYPVISKFLGAPCQFGKCPEGAMTCGKPLERRK